MFILLLFIKILQANLKLCTLHDEQKYTYRNKILITAIPFNFKLTLPFKKDSFYFYFLWTLKDVSNNEQWHFSGKITKLIHIKSEII